MPPSTAHSQQSVFPARLRALADAEAFARGFADLQKLAHGDAMRLTLVIEELFTNTVKHGYGNETDSPVRIALDILDGSVRILYEDWAPRYDPLARFSVAPPSLEAPAAERSPGGLGAYLVGQLVTDARYAYEGGINRLWLTLRQGG
ncbi:MAG TPA: ATP-binding protein [Casimicrobiaceae bacterium]